MSLEVVDLFVKVVKILVVMASLAFVYCSIGVFIELFSNKAVCFLRKNTTTYIINRKFMLIEIILIVGIYLFNKGISNSLSLHLELLVLFVSYLLIKAGEISIYPKIKHKLHLKEKPFTKKDLITYFIGLLIVTTISSVSLESSSMSIMIGIMLLATAQTYKQSLLAVYH